MGGREIKPKQELETGGLPRFCQLALHPRTASCPRLPARCSQMHRQCPTCRAAQRRTVGLQVPEVQEGASVSCVGCSEGQTHRRARSSKDTRIPAPERKQTDSHHEGPASKHRPRGSRRLTKHHRTTDRERPESWSRARSPADRPQKRVRAQPQKESCPRPESGQLPEGSSFPRLCGVHSTAEEGGGRRERRRGSSYGGQGMSGISVALSTGEEDRTAPGAMRRKVGWGQNDPDVWVSLTNSLKDQGLPAPPAPTRSRKCPRQACPDHRAGQREGAGLHTETQA